MKTCAEASLDDVDVEMSAGATTKLVGIGITGDGKARAVLSDLAVCACIGEIGLVVTRQYRCLRPEGDGSYRKGFCML